MNIRHAAARALSILGHPFLVMPAASLSAAHLRGGDHDTQVVLALTMAALVAVVFAWSAWQVRCGHWAHVDASGHRERRQLNALLLAGFVVACASAWWLAQPKIALACALAAAIIGVAMLLARWITLSLHVAFAALATFVAGAVALAVGFAVLTVAVAWSRLELGRHVLADVFAGALAGAFAGALFVFA